MYWWVVVVGVPVVVVGVLVGVPVVVVGVLVGGGGGCVKGAREV